VPPDVATGRVVVVVGGAVVVVVGGKVVVVVEDEEPAPRSDEVGVVVDGAVDVVGASVVEVLGLRRGELTDADDPGCSLATTMPMTTVAPVAATAASRVRKRSDASARRRVSGEETCRGDFIEHSLGRLRQMQTAADTSSLVSCCGRPVKHPRFSCAIIWPRKQSAIVYERVGSLSQKRSPMCVGASRHLVHRTGQSTERT
jgi:hypothetical protein